jgi:hypothetical protein
VFGVVGVVVVGETAAAELVVLVLVPETFPVGGLLLVLAVVTVVLVADTEPVIDALELDEVLLDELLEIERLVELLLELLLVVLVVVLVVVLLDCCCDTTVKHSVSLLVSVSAR